MGLSIPNIPSESNTGIPLDELKQVRSDIILLQQSVSAKKNEISGIGASESIKAKGMIILESKHGW